MIEEMYLFLCFLALEIRIDSSFYFDELKKFKKFNDDDDDDEHPYDGFEN